MLQTLQALMCPKSDLFQVRIEAELGREVEEFVEEQQEAAAAEGRDLSAPEARRRLVREGLGAARGEQTNTQALRAELEEYHNPDTGTWLEVTRHAPPTVQALTAGVGVVLVSLVVLVGGLIGQDLGVTAPMVVIQLSFVGVLGGLLTVVLSPVIGRIITIISNLTGI